MLDSFHPLLKWIALMTTSFPVPDSPRIRTVNAWGPLKWPSAASKIHSGHPALNHVNCDGFLQRATHLCHVAGLCEVCGGDSRILGTLSNVEQESRTYKDPIGHNLLRAVYG